MRRPDHDGPRLAELAGLLADRTRARFCLALLDGRAWTSGELARGAGVSASTASEQLTRLVQGGLLTEERQGRHRYVRLADDSIAQLVEDLAAHAAPAAPRTLRSAGAGSAMARARTCYDHLAGRLGVLVTEAMVRRGLLQHATGFAVTREGVDWFRGVGAPLEPGGGRRPLARSCLDWTERRPHLAGVAGAAFCRRFLDAGWGERIGTQRALRITPSGRTALQDLLGIAPEDLERDAPAPARGTGRA